MTKSLFPVKTWIQTAIINFCIVALAGITMRYKINFPLPAVNQKHLLYAHSNFAFMGWVTIILMVLLVNYLLRHDVQTYYNKYNWILIGGCVAAYGMFVSFIIQGYNYISIAFSTFSIVVTWAFIICYWIDLRKVEDKSFAPSWFKAALILIAIASLGEITLAYLMVNFSTVQDYYFAALYFFLHFQYNGWFLFVCFGLFFAYIYRKGFHRIAGINKNLFVIMAITVAPTFLLSILWLKLPRYLALIANISGILQLLVLFYFCRIFPLVVKRFPKKISGTSRYLWTMAAIAFILKIVLQTFSIIPFFSNYAFGYRPIVIGYLHLSFLVIISFFILGYINQILHEAGGSISTPGVIIFSIGVLLQEFTLMGQGLEVLNFEPLPYANIILFYSAVIMGGALIWIAATIKNQTTGWKAPDYAVTDAEGAK